MNWKDRENHERGDGVFKNLFGGKKQTQDPNQIDSETAAGIVVKIGREKLHAQWTSLKEDIVGYEEALGHVEVCFVNTPSPRFWFSLSFQIHSTESS